jgi:hypothetical protein
MKLKNMKSPFCEIETKAEVHGLYGNNFRIEYMSCDTLAKDEAIRVYASRENSTPIVGRSVKKETVLFRYDPGSYDAPLPKIIAVAPDRIMISVPRVSSIEEQSRQWENLTIDYDIGIVDYPSNKSSQPTR